MNTEPPQGDDLHRMLVSMKQNVLERATPRPKRHGRRAGIVIGIITVLALGTAGGGVALGLIPTTFTAEPAPTTAPTDEPTHVETPTGSPLIDHTTPTPTPNPTPTSTRAPYSLSDPSTWTISGKEVGPIALGGPIAGELDDLDASYTREVENACPSPTVTNWYREGGAPLTVVEQDGKVWGVAIGTSMATKPNGPTTPEGFGAGSQLADVRAAYPDLTFVSSGSFPNEGEPYSMWTIERNGYHITFQTAEDAKTIGLVWVSSNAEVPYEFCG